MFRIEFINKEVDVISMLYNSVLVRFSGEFGVKSSQTQDYIENLLRGNIKNALKTEGYAELINRLQIISRQGRYYLVPKTPADSDIDTLISIIGRMFGVSSVSPCFQSSMKEKTSLRTIPAKLMLANSLFPSKVEIRIFDKTEIDEKNWRKDIYELCEKFKKEDQDNNRVSKKRFEVNKNWKMGPWLCRREKKLEIEVFEQKAYITVERIKGPGGFPLGLEDPLVALVSGGIDSPVAAWMAMKRGAPIIMVIMNSSDGSGRPPSSDASVKEKALKEAKILSEYMIGFKEPKIFLVPYGKALSELAKAGGDSGVTCLLCKRFMYRVAERVAYNYDAKGIVTGEILGEQASQTAQNLMVLNDIVHLPIFRPLFGFDKDEVIEKSRQIGTAIVSDMTQTPCFGVPDRPQTRAEISTVEKAEQKVHIEELIEECMKNTKQIMVKELD
ncbi:tRNA sulfurtransferase [Candidatus Tiddalikarchaeum anstoanum]|nr:tRNA sulfurtransferase [Candidatus Tiddalikarchaeum anstoanum]